MLLRKRTPGQESNHADAGWLDVAPIQVEGADVTINRYFLSHPEMVLGTLSRKDTLYAEGFSVVGTGDLAGQLREAIARLPAVDKSVSEQPNPPPSAHAHDKNVASIPPPRSPAENTTMINPCSE